MISLNLLQHKKEYEKIEMLLRRHWIIPVRNIVILLLQIVLPALVAWLFQEYLFLLLAHAIAGPLLVLLASTYALFVWLLFFHNFVDYYLDVWIVTNERFVHVEQQGLFGRRVTELRYYRVQDVTSEVGGVIPTLFDYGNIYVQTASAEPRFAMKQVPHAHAIARRIHELLEADRPYHEHKNG